MDAKVYNTEGKQVRLVTLPEDVFGLKWNADLVHQVTTGMQANERENVAHVKTRGQVAGGGKKPWRQKGTGRARHGSIRSPLWVGGGITHGPNPLKDYSQKINRKMRVKALYTVLSQKLKDGEILFVDTLAVGSGKTKDAKKTLMQLAAISGFEGLSKKRLNAALVALKKKDAPTTLAMRNFSNLLVDEVRNLNPLSVLSHKYLLISEPEDSLQALRSRSAKKK